MNPAEFETHRRYLTGIAYRMLGTLSDAEDMVQEAWLRVQGSETPEHPRAWLTRIVTRLCLDELKSARHQRLSYVGPWLPEPLHDISDFTGAKANATDLSDDLSIGLLYALERLSPPERAAFLLHDVFGLGFADISVTLERSEVACRQLASRARKAVRSPSPPRFTISEEDERSFLRAFLDAAESGDVSALETLLAQDVRLCSDGGGKAPAALNVLEGRRRVLRFIIGVQRKFRRHTITQVRFVPVNGALAVLSHHADGSIDLMTLERTSEGIRDIFFMRNPDKLRHFAEAMPPPL